MPHFPRAAAETFLSKEGWTMAEQNKGAGPEERQKRLLLVVDGDAAHLHYTSILLQRLEYNIHTTKRAEDALEMVEVALPALVLTEIALAGMDGYELLKKIKRNPRTFAIPVIVATSSREPEVKEACLREGCTAYFQKPVDPDLLYAAIQKATESQPRRYIRLNTCLNVIVGEEKAAEQSVISDYITALSEQGMYVSTLKPRAVGTQIPITIFLEGTRIKVEGSVLYSFQQGGGPLKTPGMGIRFTRIEPEDEARIKIFIRKELTKGLPVRRSSSSLF
jgi:CheY-like chemotaxis protein/Tfp pilus assembly protein PilZ